MLGTWIVTLPPLVVIITVLLTQRMLLAFLLGILSSALIVTQGNPVQAVLLSLQKIWVSTGLPHVTSIQGFLSSWNLLIFIFLLTIGVLIALLSHTGAAAAYVTIVRKKVRSKKAAESASLILSLLFFIDDYFSALTVGSVMRPLAELYHVHPVKLAFLVTTMATPITIVAPVSSWVGEIILQLKQIGIGPAGTTTVILADPYMVFLKAIPCIMYALILIASTWYIVLRGISYGPMAAYDTMAVQAPTTVIPKHTTQASLFDFLFPLLLLIAGVFALLLYTGGFVGFGGSANFVTALKFGSVHQALFGGGLLSLAISSIYFFAKGSITRTSFLKCVRMGCSLMFPSILMLICAWSLGNILKNDLQTGTYIATVVSNVITIEFFPVVCFIFAGLIACMIGSAWATIGLMFPIIIDMLQKLLHLGFNTPIEAVPLIFPVLGATLSGCIIGTQLSVISDNPIMSAASTGANHLEHVKTMAWYIIPVGIASATSFILIGFTSASLGIGTSMFLSLAIGLCFSLGLLELANYVFGKRQR